MAAQVQSTKTTKQTTMLPPSRLYDANDLEKTLGGLYDVLGYLSLTDLMMIQSNTSAKSLYCDGRAVIVDVLRVVIQTAAQSAKQILAQGFSPCEDEAMLAHLERSAFIAKQMVKLNQLAASEPGLSAYGPCDQSVTLINASFGTHLHHLRHQSNLTRTQAANQLDVDYALIKDVELGHACFDVGKLIGYCSIVGKGFIDVMAQFYASHTEPKTHQTMARPTNQHTDSEN